MCSSPASPALRTPWRDAATKRKKRGREITPSAPKIETTGYLSKNAALLLPSAPGDKMRALNMRPRLALYSRKSPPLLMECYWRGTAFLQLG